MLGAEIEASQTFDSSVGKIKLRTWRRNIQGSRSGIRRL